MSYPVYSTRFLIASGRAGVTSYWVPAGFRAVLRDIEIINPQGHGTDFTVYVAGGLLAFFRFQEAQTYRQQAVMVPAYSGEDLSVHQYLNDTGMILSGHLLREEGLRRGAPPATSSSLEDYLAGIEGEPRPA